jgi:hypothetical protein
MALRPCTIAFLLTNPKFATVSGTGNHLMKMLPIVAGLAFALASAGAYAQTAPGCPQKAGEGGSDPLLTQKAADAGNNPSLPQKAADAGNNPSLPQKAGEGGSDPLLTQKAADAGNNPSLPQKAAEGVGGLPCKG